MWTWNGLLLHCLQDRGNHHFPPAVRRPPRLLQQVAIQMLVTDEYLRHLVEHGRVLQGPEEERKGRAVRDLVEGEDGRLLHVRVGVLQGAMQRGERLAVAAVAEGRGGGGADAPVA